MRVLGLSGSPAPVAHSRRLLDAAVSQLSGRGHDVDVLDLRDLTIPMLDTVWYRGDDQHPSADVRRLRQAVANTDALLLATSVQHASYSGLLKGALDHLHADAMAARPVGLLANAGNVRGATTACEHLRAVVKAMSGWSTPTQVATSPKDYDPDGGPLSSAPMLRRLGAMADEMELLVAGARATRGGSK